MISILGKRGKKSRAHYEGRRRLSENGRGFSHTITTFQKFQKVYLQMGFCLENPNKIK